MFYTRRLKVFGSTSLTIERAERDKDASEHKLNENQSLTKEITLNMSRFK